MSKQAMVAQGHTAPRNTTAQVMPLHMLFCKSCVQGMGIRLEFLRGNAGAQKATLKKIKAALVAVMNMVDRNGFVLTFKRGDKFIVKCKANNEDFVGNGDCCHVRMMADKLNKLKQMSSDRTAGVCWKQEITTTTMSTWRNERTGTTRKNAETMRMMKIRAVMMFIIAQVALTK